MVYNLPFSDQEPTSPSEEVIKSRAQILGDSDIRYCRLCSVHLETCAAQVALAEGVQT